MTLPTVLIGSFLTLMTGVALLILNERFDRWFPPLEAALARCVRWSASLPVRPRPFTAHEGMMGTG